jgi:amidase
VSLAVPDYAGGIGSGVRGKKIGIATNLSGIDVDVRRVLDAAAAAFKGAGATLVDVALPASLQQASYDWLPLCAAETALAHEATYPARAAEYGPVLAAFIDVGRRLTGVEYARLMGRRAALSGDLAKLMDSVDLLLLPVMGTAAPTIQMQQQAGRDPDAVAARLRYTAPFDMSGQPTLTLPGGFTARGVPVGFQIVGRAFGEAAILAAGHAYQQASDWHTRHPSL